MVKTNYLWDEVSDNVIAEYESGVATAVYTQEPGLYGNLISQRRSGISHFYHFDARGDTRNLTDSAQNVTDSKTYDAWGNVISATGSTTTPYRFVGRKGYQQDLTMPNVYVRARQCQLLLGRWASRDPLSYLDGVNLYAYVNNCVIMTLDPSGLWPGYGLYCGLRNGPGIPIDALDRACQRHDRCLATIWDWVNPFCLYLCEKAFCTEVRGVIRSVCYDAPDLSDCLIAARLIEVYACRYELPDVIIIFP